MDLIRNQWHLWFSALKQLERLVKSSIHLGLNDARQMRIRRAMGKSMVHNVLEHEKIVDELQSSIFPAEPVRISFVAAVRRVGNPNHRLAYFLQSVVDCAYDLNTVEVILGVDSDDDIAYYLALKNQFKNRLRFRIFVAPRRLGYEGLHLYDKQLIPRMAKGSRMMCDYSDDCSVMLKHFDKTLLRIDAHYPDNIYFIHTRYTNRAEYLGNVAAEPLRLYWMLQAHSPYSFFPIVSRKVIECAENALQELPEPQRAQWSPFANAWICDCYLDILSNLVKAEGFDRIHAVPMIRIKPHNIYTPYQNRKDDFGMSAANRAFITLLSQYTQNHLKRIAQLVARAAQAVPPLAHKEADPAELIAKSNRQLGLLEDESDRAAEQQHEQRLAS